jgi:hypothetical protein
MCAMMPVDVLADYCKRYTLLHFHTELDNAAMKFHLHGDMGDLADTLVCVIGRDTLVHVISIMKERYN